MARIKVTYAAQDVAIADLDGKVWDTAEIITVDKYWSGETAPPGRMFSARLLWSDTALYVRFDAEQTEPLIVSDRPDLNEKTMGLWDRDVCEIFIAPDGKANKSYFEFEIAPTGEWLDAAISLTPVGRLANWEYTSKLGSAVRIENGRVVMAIKIPFDSLEKTPKFGDVWLGNLFRCVGKGPARGYLAWSPTKTAEPNFHVPSRFGEFEFVGT